MPDKPIDADALCAGYFEAITALLRRILDDERAAARPCRRKARRPDRGRSAGPHLRPRRPFQPGDPGAVLPRRRADAHERHPRRRHAALQRRPALDGDRAPARLWQDRHRRPRPRRQRHADPRQRLWHQCRADRCGPRGEAARRLRHRRQFARARQQHRARPSGAPPHQAEPARPRRHRHRHQGAGRRRAGAHGQGMGEAIAAVSTFANAFALNSLVIRTVRQARRPWHRAAGLAQRQRTGRRRSQRPLHRPLPRIACGRCARRPDLVGRDPATARPPSPCGDGRIADVRAEPRPPDDAAFVAPGLVDLQVNGYAGLDLNGRRPDARTVADLCRALLPRSARRASCRPSSRPPRRQSLSGSPPSPRRGETCRSWRAAMPARFMSKAPSSRPRTGPRGAHAGAMCGLPMRTSSRAGSRLRGGWCGIVTLSPEVPTRRRPISPGSPARASASRIGHSAATPSIARAAASRRPPLHPSGQRHRRHAAAPPERDLGAARRRPPDRHLHLRRPSPAGRDVPAP